MFFYSCVQGVLFIFLRRIFAVSINNHSYKLVLYWITVSSNFTRPQIDFIFWHFPHIEFLIPLKSAKVLFHSTKPRTSYQFNLSTQMWLNETNLKTSRPPLGKYNKWRKIASSRTFSHQDSRKLTITWLFFFVDDKEMNFWIASSNRKFSTSCIFCVTSLLRGRSVLLYSTLLQ